MKPQRSALPRPTYGSALEQARVRCRHLARVRLERRQIPQQFPDGRFDLILMSEIGYYLSQSDLTRTIRLIRQALKRPGQAFLVHWTPEAGDVRSPAIRSTSSR